MTTEALVRSDLESDAVDAAPPGSAGVGHGALDPFALTSVAETLELIVGIARQTFGENGAGILLATDGGLASTAASGAQARRADDLQVDHHQGPGFQAVNGRQPVISPSSGSTADGDSGLRRPRTWVCDQFCPWH